MKTTTYLALAVACATLLSACATRSIGPAGVPFDAENPRVYVVGNQIVVDQEPIFITRKGATIVWELPADQKLTFPADGIAIKAERGDFDCRVGEGGTRYACEWKNAKPRTFYKYTIKVRRGGEALTPLDPFLFGDF